MRVTLVGYTEFIPPYINPDDEDRWTTDACGGQALAEYAGRACYRSFHKPNPKTATNADYLKHILDVGHESVLEHGVASFDIQGVSRSLTHEFIRHRHLSPSQLSQRFVDESGVEFVIPPLIEGDADLAYEFERDMEIIRAMYVKWVDKLTDRFPNANRKQVRQAARAVLPNATETKLVMTGNYRAWRHFINLRASEAADVEIRALAVEILRQMWKVAPNVFDDFTIVTLEDGTEVVDFADAWGEPA